MALLSLRVNSSIELRGVVMWMISWVFLWETPYLYTFCLNIFCRNLFIGEKMSWL